MLLDCSCLAKLAEIGPKYSKHFLLTWGVELLATFTQIASIYLVYI